jgi:hypothetical protein
MESLGNNHGFLDGNKRIGFTATEVFLRRNGSYIEVDAQEGHEFIYGSMDRQELDRQEFRSPFMFMTLVVHRSAHKQVPRLRIAIEKANRNAPRGMIDFCEVSLGRLSS